MKKNKTDQTHVTHLIFLSLSILSLLTVSLYWKEEFILTILLIILSTGMMLIQGMTKNRLINYVFFAVTGSIAEIIAIKSGAWHYAESSILEIPLWLPFLWGTAYLFIEKEINTIKKYVKQG